MSGRTGERARRSGRNRELQTLKWLEDDDEWVVFRLTLACADLLAIRHDRTPLLIEVKSTARSPWVAFGPAERDKLAHLARWIGAKAVVAWWPPKTRAPVLYFQSDWPPASAEAAQ